MKGVIHYCTIYVCIYFMVSVRRNNKHKKEKKTTFAHNHVHTYRVTVKICCHSSLTPGHVLPYGRGLLGAIWPMSLTLTGLESRLSC